MTRPWLFLSTAAATAAAGVALAGLLTLQAGCTTVECGTGTIERDGDCVGANLGTEAALCGEGTILVNGICVAEAVCDPSSTVLVPVGDGTFVCEGQGGAELPACGMPLPCPQASGATTSICGEFYDLETNEKTGAQSGAAVRCDPNALASSGPCSHKLEFYDALAFSQGLSTQLTYDADDLIYDSCGRFRVTGLMAAGSNITAVGARGDVSRGNVTSGIAVRVTGGGTYANQRLYTVTQATNQKWSQALGRDNIAATGVYVSIHARLPNLTPVEDVVLTGASGGNAANFYFSDTDPNTRSTPNTTDNDTGANGTAILLDQPNIGTFSSSGGTLPAGCNWNTISGGNIPGVYFVQLRVPFIGSSTTDICTTP
jgi:hypothetical protein